MVLEEDCEDNEVKLLANVEEDVEVDEVEVIEP